MPWSKIFTVNCVPVGVGVGEPCGVGDTVGCAVGLGAVVGMEVGPGVGVTVGIGVSFLVGSYDDGLFTLPSTWQVGSSPSISPLPLLSFESEQVLLPCSPSLLGS